MKLYSILYCLVFPFFRLLYPLHVIGRERLPEGGCVVCANHSSNWDALFMAFALGRKAFPVFAAKIEMSRIPVLSGILRAIGVIFIDRDANDTKAMRQMLSAVSGGSAKLILFPEGHRVSEGEAASAKAGAIVIASHTGAPLIPVFIPREKRLFRANTVVLGEPYSIGKVRGAERELKARELMQKIDRLRDIS
ncbi:MAG: 1-acyl-sn-glycerol-3-phosphate acyltransferase [Oscillospiraceae bacterium]|jgi:1-acyl-sn-glycerol-3-phosphate acyltransferase|nr:1-acyl-sn-glycerol-3-phosphate acyltransferase [Oscillospiraceae bacterium]